MSLQRKAQHLVFSGLLAVLTLVFIISVVFPNSYAATYVGIAAGSIWMISVKVFMPKCTNCSRPLFIQRDGVGFNFPGNHCKNCGIHFDQQA